MNTETGKADDGRSSQAAGYAPGDVAWYDNWTEPRRLVTQVVGPFVDVLNEAGGKNTVHFSTLQSSEKWASECRRCSDSWNHQHKSLETHIRENTTPDWSEPRQWAEWRRVHNAELSERRDNNKI